MIGDAETFVVKLLDFGCAHLGSKNADGLMIMRRVVGTVSYMCVPALSDLCKGCHNEGHVIHLSMRRLIKPDIVRLSVLRRAPELLELSLEKSRMSPLNPAESFVYDQVHTFIQGNGDTSGLKCCRRGHHCS